MATTTAYIDESGNLGKDGPYFIISFLVPYQPKRLKNIFKKACLDFSETEVPLSEIKSSILSVPRKQELLNKMTQKNDFECGYIVAEKSGIYQKLLSDKNVCYNYLCALMIRPLLQNKTEDIHVILDNHTQKVTSINSLKDHLKIKAYTEWDFKGNLTVEYKDSKMNFQLQCVDLISNVVYGRYTYQKRNGLYGMIQNHVKNVQLFPRHKFSFLSTIDQKVKPDRLKLA